MVSGRGIEAVVAVNHAQGNQVSLRWLLYDGHGNLVRTMAPDYTLSAFQWRGVWGELQGVLGVGRGYCANLGHPEDETGLVYMRARYYEPATGRFLSEDPARDGVNWYLYADGNPVGKVDYSGRIAAFVVAFLVGAAIGIGFYIGYQLATGQPITLEGIITAGLGGGILGLAVFATAAGAVALIQALARAGILFSLETGLGAELITLFSSFMNAGASYSAAGIGMFAFGTAGLGAGYVTGLSAKALHIAYSYQFRVAMWMGLLEVD